MSADDPAPDGTAPPGDRPAPALVLRHGTARVEFVRWEDRWRHRVVVGGAVTAGQGSRDVIDAPSAIEWLSVEGLATVPARMPPSPVFTSVMRLDVPQAAGAIVGIGHAGSGHCSLEVTADPERDSTFRFHVACRLFAAWPGLGSTYRCSGAGFLSPSAARCLVVEALAAPGGSAPSTVSWSYRIGPDGLAAIAGAVVRDGLQTPDG